MRTNVILGFSAVIPLSLATSLFVACGASGDAEEPAESNSPTPFSADAGVDATVQPRERDASIDRTIPIDGDGIRDARPHDGSSTSPPSDAERGEASSMIDANNVDGGVDSGTIEAGTVDSGFAPVGTSCLPINATQERVCGRCGVEKRLCFSSGDGGASWLEWGPCLGEKPDAGLPNTTISLPCKMCGTRKLTYDSQCNPTVGFCEPSANAECEVGQGEWVQGLSCTGGLGRYRSCRTDCTWEPYSDCTSYVNANRLVIAPSTNGMSNTVSGTFPFDDGARGKRLINSSDETCPLGTSYPSSSMVKFGYVEVVNRTAQTATLSIWNGGEDTQMAAYAGSTIPTDDAARRACLPGTKATDSCPTSLAAQCNGPAQTSTAGITGVKVGPNSSATVYTGMYSTSSSVAEYKLFVRTDELR